MLRPLWGRVGGRDKLAELAGTNGSSLSTINSGKQDLGYTLGRRLAAALGVSLEELGAPLDLAHPSPIVAELSEIRATLETMNGDFGNQIARQLRNQTDLLAKLTALEVRLSEAVDSAATRLEDAARRLDQAAEALDRQARKRRPA